MCQFMLVYSTRFQSYMYILSLLLTVTVGNHCKHVYHHACVWRGLTVNEDSCTRPVSMCVCRRVHTRTRALQRQGECVQECTSHPGVVLHNSLHLPPNRSLSCQTAQVYLPAPLGPWAFARDAQSAGSGRPTEHGGNSPDWETDPLCPWSLIPQLFCLAPRVLLPGRVQTGGAPWPEEVGDVQWSLG